ncbi:MAG: hypothetical protein K2K54_11720 [Lachnospiraceae bacterium]|nr:hypothetical protein [Lachnospiraceae bacterium]
MESYQMEELAPIVAELAEKYGGYESTSVSYEKAQMLMDAVLYCIHEYEAGGGDMLMDKKVSAKEAYSFGRQLVTQKVKKLTALYNEMMPDFKDYGSLCLKETIVKGIPAFLQRYDTKFNPQDTMLTLDYPILTDISELTGVDAVFGYVRDIYLEQSFLREFHPIYVSEVLSVLHDEYEMLVENICSIVLRNTVGHILTDKPLSEKGFCDEEYGDFKRIFEGKSGEEIQSMVREAIWCIVRQIPGENQELLEYLYQDAGNLASRIQNAVEHDCFESIFFV